MSTHVPVALAMLLIIVPSARAESFNIGPIKNTNPKDVSAIWAECETTADGQRMTCEFTQVWARLAKTPEDAAAEVEKVLREVTPREMGQTCKDQRKQMTDLFSKVEAAQDVAPRFKEFVTGMARRLDAMCDKPTNETVREFLRYSLEKDTKTCRIWANPWKETFTRQLGNRWVSNRGPSGLCGVIIVSTLESKPFDPKEPDSLLRLWSYETQKIVTNKQAAGPLCPVDETKVRYSWDAKDFDRSCEFIEFGF